MLFLVARQLAIGAVVGLLWSVPILQVGLLVLLRPYKSRWASFLEFWCVGFVPVICIILLLLMTSVGGASNYTWTLMVIILVWVVVIGYFVLSLVHHAIVFVRWLRRRSGDAPSDSNSGSNDD